MTSSGRLWQQLITSPVAFLRPSFLLLATLAMHLHHTSNIIHPTSYILHYTSYIIHPTLYTLHHTLLPSTPACNMCCASTFYTFTVYILRYILLPTTSYRCHASTLYFIHYTASVSGWFSVVGRGIKCLFILISMLFCSELFVFFISSITDTLASLVYCSQENCAHAVHINSISKMLQDYTLVLSKMVLMLIFSIGRSKYTTFLIKSGSARVWWKSRING